MGDEKSTKAVVELSFSDSELNFHTGELLLQRSDKGIPQVMKYGLFQGHDKDLVLKQSERLILVDNAALYLASLKEERADAALKDF